jgi:asparagine synthase (glutamine-hydrolysing)
VSGRATPRPHVAIVVQNLPVPFDRRVWLECQALRDAGYEVSVVCPKGPGDPSYQLHEGVHLYKYRAFPPITHQVAFVGEYAWSVTASFLGLCRAWRRRPFEVVQLCNPPDVLWAAAVPFKIGRGVRIVFDQHDLCPELYESRFPDGPAIVHRALLGTERITYACADRVISTNESYRSVALRRGHKDPDAVTVVRTGPDPDRMQAGEPVEELRRGHKHLLAYLGVMGPQDGVDLALHAMHHIVHTHGRSDVGLTLIGDGDAAPALRRLADELNLADRVHFTGRIPDAEVAGILSTAVVGLCPDPRNPLNDVSTMNKTMEYLSYGLPVVSFDLIETKVSAGPAALYAQPNRTEDFAEKVLELLDDELRRTQMGETGRRRVEEQLAWRCQVPAYVSLYDQLTSRRGSRRPGRGVDGRGTRCAG